MGVVVFSVVDFRAMFPEFTEDAGFSDAMLGGCFTRATLTLNNTDASPVSDLTQRALLLYLLTAHVAFLWQRGGGSVGRIASAGEGSVSASFDMPSSPRAAWFNQTQYGAQYWQAVLPYRLGRYIGA